MGSSFRNQIKRWNRRYNTLIADGSSHAQALETLYSQGVNPKYTGPSDNPVIGMAPAPRHVINGILEFSGTVLQRHDGSVEIDRYRHTNAAWGSLKEGTDNAAAVSEAISISH